jgi:hypothetical protein
MMMVLTALAVAPVACGPRSETASSAPAVAPQILTVADISRMVQSGQQPGVVLAEMQRTGTVYDLTTIQTQGLRADGMPASLLSEMELTRRYALEKEPSLATSRERWKQIDGIWYGGLPLGWPAEWVRRGPSTGEVYR